MDYFFILEKYSGPRSRHTCPGCGKHRQFTLYVSAETGEHLADYVGICNRVDKCGYHYSPKNYFRDNPQSNGKARSENNVKRFTIATRKQPEKIDFLPWDYVNKSLSQTHLLDNRFFQYLVKVVGEQKALNVSKRFSIGSSNHWPGSVVFWLIDANGNVRSGRVMLYDSTGHRVQHPYTHITWVHSILKKKGTIQSFNLGQCLFGEHQLRQSNSQEVAIVESEKTAVIASIYLPQLTWLACGGLSNLNPDKLSVLSKRKIILYPDLGGFEKWNEKAMHLRQSGFRITVSDLLEKATWVTELDRSEGLDLADYLVKMNPPKSDIETLTEKYPAVSELIKRFDLVKT